jgi:hypothetical protein
VQSSADLKGKAYNTFIKLKNQIKNNKNRHIKEFFIDNRKEYINKKLKIISIKYNIIYKLSPIYTKEPNSLIKRINLTLLNKVRSILIQLGAPNYL